MNFVYFFKIRILFLVILFYTFSIYKLLILLVFCDKLIKKFQIIEPGNISDNPDKNTPSDNDLKVNNELFALNNFKGGENTNANCNAENPSNQSDNAIESTFSNKNLEAKEIITDLSSGSQLQKSNLEKLSELKNSEIYKFRKFYCVICSK